MRPEITHVQFSSICVFNLTQFVLFLTAISMPSTGSSESSEKVTLMQDMACEGLYLYFMGTKADMSDFCPIMQRV